MSLRTSSTYDEKGRKFSVGLVAKRGIELNVSRRELARTNGPDRCIDGKELFSRNWRRVEDIRG